MVFICYVMFQIGIRNENLYGVTIEPKNEIDIGNLNLLVSSNEEILMKYAFWITFTGKMTAKTKVAQKLRYDTIFTAD